MAKVPDYHQHLSAIEECAGRGMTHDEIADLLAIATRTFRHWCKEYPEVYGAYRQGRAKAKMYIAGRLFDFIREGNITATIFYLKTQCGWRDNGRIAEDAIVDTTPQVLDEKSESRTKELIYESELELQAMDAIRANTDD
ncbi:hypothetical protein B7486_45710 [cyanobacterium TDX16]|nr:hypothetical protein B7486_45710 [cyanobacterium TDX16]